MDVFLIVLVIVSIVGTCTYVMLRNKNSGASHVPPAPSASGPVAPTGIPKTTIRTAVPPAPGGKPVVPPAPKPAPMAGAAGYKTAPVTVAPMDDYICLYSFKEVRKNWRCPVCDGENSDDSRMCQICGHQH